MSTAAPTSPATGTNAVAVKEDNAGAPRPTHAPKASKPATASKTVGTPGTSTASTRWACPGGTVLGVPGWVGAKDCVMQSA